MGNCIKKSDMGNLIRPFIAPPTIRKTINQGELSQIVFNKTDCNYSIYWDKEYDLIDEDDLKRYLLSNINNDYVSEAFDCDDFSFSLLGRVREWAYNRTNRKGGLSFGILAGDLKLNDFDDYRGHAVCFFVTSDKKVKLLDGMTNEILDIRPSMTIDQLII